MAFAWLAQELWASVRASAAIAAAHVKSNRQLPLVLATRCGTAFVAKQMFSVRLVQFYPLLGKHSS